jgi:hypothetical protein
MLPSGSYEPRVVYNIEELATKLQARLFRELGILVHSNIKIIDARTAANRPRALPIVPKARGWNLAHA